MDRRIIHWATVLTMLLGVTLPLGAQKPFGSGHFGRWLDDPSGLPSYLYMIDQLRDPKAITPVNPSFRLPTEHTHQLGNDRLVATASNYGVVQVRQDDGAPMILNEVHPDQHQHGGGFGYLTDGRVSLSTRYEGDGSTTFHRIFGVGYLRKRVSRPPYVVDHIILAPFGDDPVLVSQVVVQNQGTNPARLRWIEYWGAQHYPLSFAPAARGLAAGDVDLVHSERRRQAARFEQTFQRVDTTGLMDTKALPRDGRSSPALREPRQEDPHPPPVFVAALDGPVSGFSTDARAFFGEGGALRPDGLAHPLDGSLTPAPGEGAFLLERSFTLAPGEGRTLYFVFGYVPQESRLDDLLAKYRNHPEMHWAQSNTAWRFVGLRLSTEAEPWVERELVWHNYYLRSATTYDSFFGEHILSQGQVSQWLMGFHGAARDPLQHALPWVFSQPETVKGILRHTLKQIQPDGGIPYGIVGHGSILPTEKRPSDFDLWLLWLSSEYVLATRDLAFLAERVATYPLSGPTSRQESVAGLLRASFLHLVDTIGVGRHGLLRLSSGDWNDTLLAPLSRDQRAQAQTAGESVLNAAMASYVLDLYAELLIYSGNGELAPRARQIASDQRRAVRAQWSERWFRRAWLTPELGWLGDQRLWLEPQPWAIIGGAATPEQTATLVQALDQLLRSDSPIGARLLSQPLAAGAGSGNDLAFPAAPAAAGVLTNGGVWPSINGILIWALARVDGRLAWEEWRKNTLAYHAEAYPDIWYGIWSGPNAYNSTLARHPGATQFGGSVRNANGKETFPAFNGTDFPVMNAHSHAWPLYSVVKLLGVEFDAEGLTLRPSLPLESYAFASPLLGLSRTPQGFKGWYGPSQPGEWRVRFELPETGSRPTGRVRLNGMTIPPLPSPPGVIEFRGEGSANAPLRFEIPLVPEE